MDLYLISGLGADERIFRELTFPADHYVHYIKWLEPLSPKESLDAYCRRLCEQIDQTKTFILIGLSFGGMVACALNTIVKPCKTILISSVAVRAELPLVYKLAGSLGIIRLLPSKPPPGLMKVLEWFMGVETPADRALVRQFIRCSVPGFNKWAMSEAANWRRTEPPDNMYQLHGAADRIFPVSINNAGYIIRGGGHFMVLNRPEKVSRILSDILTTSEGNHSKV